jgi:hypothetical protein
LPLKTQAPLVCHPDQEHLLAKGERLLVTDGRLLARLKRTIRLENLKHLPFQRIILFEQTHRALLMNGKLE